ncbi:hypothetical protein [Paenibacillus amylolyticus]|uniref:hypothetical protein n=1 Tax=Paenibacillus amylolyticus TaxID=1451 RepID=UPI003EC127F1
MHVKLEDGRYVMALTTDDIKQNLSTVSTRDLHAELARRTGVREIAKERNLNVDNIEYHDGIFWYCVRGGSKGSATLIRYPLAEYAVYP